MASKRKWERDGACVGLDPEMFFPLSKGRHASSEAKRVCARCRVSKECLAFALESGVSGVWGGTTEEERRAMRQARRTGRPRHDVA